MDLMNSIQLDSFYQNYYMKEQWKIIENYPNYKISNYGNIISINYRMKKNSNVKLKLQQDEDGYKMIFLYSKNLRKLVRIHILVANAFLPKIEGKNIVNHIDGNKSNNYYLNLEWSTVKENNDHALKNGLKENIKSYKIVKVLDINTNITYNSIKEVSEIFNIEYTRLVKMLNNKIKNTTNFKIL